MNILIITLGSLGDLLPFLTVAKELKQRKHVVTIATNAGYETLVRMSGYQFQPIWDMAPQTQCLDELLLNQPEEAWRTIQRDMLEPATQPTFDFIKSATRDQRTVVLASWCAYGAVQANEALNTPLCLVYLSPFAIAQDVRQQDPHCGRNHKPHRIAFFPDWFGAVPRTAHQDLLFAGFPFPDDALVPPLPAEVMAFLDAGAKPVIFTPGTFVKKSRNFFRDSVEVCEELGLRAIFLTPQREEIPDLTPRQIRHYKYIALQTLAPRCRAIVHHGGIGTIAQALRAGIPQLAAPIFFDQFANAQCIRSLGVADSIAANTYNSFDVSRKLHALLQSDTVRNSCERVRSRLDPTAIQTICEQVESIF
jgi:rhamnosyltransferase subunit B